MIPIIGRDFKSDAKLLEKLCAEAPAAYRLLHKVTGKVDWRTIEPMREKRWGDKSWDAYRKMVDLFDFMDSGITHAEIIKELGQFKPMEGLLGYHETSPFDSYKGLKGTFDKFKSAYPNLSKPWSAKKYRKP